MASQSFGAAYYLSTVLLFVLSIGRGLEFFQALALGWFALNVALVDSWMLAVDSEFDVLDPYLVPWDELRGGSGASSKAA